MGKRRQGGAVWALLLTVGIAVALGLRIGSVWSELPATMASHFGISGRADAFMSKEGFFIVVALVGGGSVAAVFAAPTLLRHLPPSLINFPNRDYWFANDQRREAAIDRWAGFLDWMGMATAAILATATELVLQANLHQTDFANGIFLTVLVVYFAFVIAGLAWMMRAFKSPEGTKR